MWKKIIETKFFRALDSFVSLAFDLAAWNFFTRIDYAQNTLFNNINLKKELWNFRPNKSLMECLWLKIKCLFQCSCLLSCCPCQPALLPLSIGKATIYCSRIWPCYFLHFNLILSRQNNVEFFVFESIGNTTFIQGVAKVSSHVRYRIIHAHCIEGFVICS